MAKTYYQSKVGLLLIEEENGKIKRLGIEEKETEKIDNSIVLLEAIKQLDEYFSGKRFIFDLPIDQKGTPYQKKVWDELVKIPYGETISYQELARRVGNVKGCRSAGGACGANNIMIIVPCHRVIGKNGKLTGFGGGLSVKEKLLQLEKSYIC